ncbi:SRPBCC family protein [Pseudonocardia sp. NPDC049154]|uniref:SRPBCC family protein n=1 Tax=Pseudonocardia sp. NPDC049154 TaxID=3155501 RepID=UPI0033CF2BE7
MLEIEVREQSSAAATAVWAIMTDATTWTAWSPVDRAEVESGHELGEVRRFRVPPVGGLPWLRLTSRERTTGYEPPRRWGYEMLSGVPGVRDYAAEVTLIPTPAGGTDIRWSVSLRPTVVGTGGVLRWMLRRLYEETAVGLARAAEAGVPPVRS